MKNYKYSIALMLAVGVLFSGLLHAERTSGKDTEKSSGLQKPAVAASNNFDGNRVDNDLENNAMIVSHNISGRSGMSWPAGNNTQTVFASGIWIGGLIGGIPHVSAGEYAGEFVGGPWGSSPSDPQHRIYKVNKTDLDDPLANPDFQNWPAEFGAPWVDVNGNGTYEPLPNGPDYPLITGDQTLWMVMNDGDPTQHSVFNTNPLGLEMQNTIFGFDRPDAFGDMMFIKCLLINKGNTDIVDTYIGLWSDPDLGDAADDFVGCVPELGLGICYNDGDDRNFAGYSGGTPAVGYDFFQGPIVPAPGETALVSGKVIQDYKNLEMTSFSKYINSPDPVWSDPNSAQEAYNLMKGLMKDGTNFADNLTGGTPFVHPGDPNLDTGPADDVYVDSDIHASGDRRFLMNAGPFTMAVGDTQEVVFAIFHAAAGEPLKSYSLLKVIDAQAQFAYDSQFILPSAPAKPTVEVTELSSEIILSWGNASEFYSIPGPKTPAGEATTFEFEGYNVYQYETITGANPRLLATYDVANNIKAIKDQVFNIELSEMIERTVQYGTDSGIKRSFSISSDALNNNAPLIPNRVYYFAVTSYSYNEVASPKVLESSAEIMAIRPQIPNTWEAGAETAMYGTALTADHTAGASDGAASVIVIDPTVLTGDDYEFFFENQHYFRDMDGIWQKTDQAGKSNSLGKVYDCTGSTVTVAAIAAAAPGTVDLTFTFDMHCGSNWVDGLWLDLPDSWTVNSWEGIGDFSYGSGAGQNCGNMDGTLDPATNTILYGNDARSGFGCIEGGQVWIVNVDGPLGFPSDIGWGIYDDAYDGTIVDITGTATATELGFEHFTIFGWNVRNTNTNVLVVEDQTIQSGIAEDHIDNGIFIPGADIGEAANPFAEGLQFMVAGPALTMKSIGVYANAAGPIDPPVDGLPYWRYPDWLVAGGDYTDQQTTGATWVFNTHPGYGAGGQATFFGSLVYYSGGNGSPNQGIRALIPYDFEMRFTGNGRAYDNWASGWPNGEVAVPFEFWNIGINTPNDPSDDYQLISWLLDDNGDDMWGLVADDHETSGGTNDPYTDRVYVMAPTNNTPGTQGHDNWWDNLIPYENVASWVAGPGEHDAGGPMDTWNVMSRTVLMNWNGGDVLAADFPANVNALEPEIGTVWRFITTKPNAANDEFTVSTSAVVGNTVAYDPDAIKVWPNPYFGYNPEERDPIEQIVQFTHLPESGSCTIRIFNIAGVPIRTLNHTDGTQFEIWDLKNNFTIPVASGMYIAVVETDSGSKVLKLAIIQPEQRLDVY